MDNETDNILSEIAQSLQPPAKAGRPAKLTRSQVDSILLSEKPLDVLALEYGVSVSTILRAKQHGYVTKDEQGAHSYIKRARGRRIANGVELSEEMRKRIAADPASAATVAGAFGVTVSYVYNQRHKYKTTRTGTPLPREVMERINTSHLDDAALAQLLALSEAIVKAVRRMKNETG